MDSPTPSTPSPQCFSPEPRSWRRCDLEECRDAAERLRATLRRVEVTESGRTWEAQAKRAREAAEHLVDQVHDLLSLVPQVATEPLPVGVPGDLRRR